MTDPNETTHPGPPDGWPICEIATCNAPIVDEQDEGLSIEMGDFEFMSEDIKGPMVSLCRVHHEALLRAVKAFFSGDGLLNRAKAVKALLRLGDKTDKGAGYLEAIRDVCLKLHLPVPDNAKLAHVIAKAEDEGRI